tara:strand:+ start:523 stop:753 length:231 start_codon:yes stop_codon:yes gene_type:complete
VLPQAGINAFWRFTAQEWLKLFMVPNWCAVGVLDVGVIWPVDQAPRSKCKILPALPIQKRIATGFLMRALPETGSG